MRRRVEGDVRTVDWGLTTQLLQHLCGTSKSITRLSDRDVENQLLDAKLLHWVLFLLVGFGHLNGIDGVVLEFFLSNSWLNKQRGMVCDRKWLWEFGAR